MQDVIAETIMQRWNDEAGRRNHRSASSVAPQNVDSIKYVGDKTLIFVGIYLL